LLSRLRRRRRLSFARVLRRQSPLTVSPYDYPRSIANPARKDTPRPRPRSIDRSCLDARVRPHARRRRDDARRFVRRRARAIDRRRRASSPSFARASRVVAVDRRFRVVRRDRARSSRRSRRGRTLGATTRLVAVRRVAARAASGINPVFNARTAMARASVPIARSRVDRSGARGVL